MLTSLVLLLGTFLLVEKALADSNLPSRFLKYASEQDERFCFGYEPGCQQNSSYSAEVGMPKCDKDVWPKAMSNFYEQADFGYVRTRRNLHEVCVSADTEKKSSLRCSDNLLYCYAKNVFFDLSNLRAATSKRYRNDVIQHGQVGGNCETFWPQVLQNNLKQAGYLSSWAHELNHFRSNALFAVNERNCDIVFERPTIAIKLDAALNMYHHFCDFINLYASQHINGSFHMDVDIIWWDTDTNEYGDHAFGVTWKAFSLWKPIELKSLDGKRVCFKSLMLPLLARQYGGLYYNMPLEPGCHGSGLVHSFSEHLLHRLAVPKWEASLEEVRLVILSRSTTFRRMLNIGKAGLFFFKNLSKG
ncbi:unnamed protein product [Caenorhabditis auriculariae]|uniref:Uncharacterized protein n=1 Tax=Caenorhabditis auriculariae TaxID=2777116 RepID=A0A8S1HGJ5_9PELO|nr:unnamed protein product [Caenorhabditis auriculariae]